MPSATILSKRNGGTPVTGLSRDDLQVGDFVSVESATTGFTTYLWELLYTPEGSTAALSGSIVGPGPLTFSADKEGPYLVRLVVTDGSVVTSQYVRLRALTAYGSLALVAAGEKYGSTPVPSDASSVGWANEQNGNLLKLLSLVQAVVGTSKTAGEAVSKGDALSIHWDPDPLFSEHRVIKSKADDSDQLVRTVYGIAGADALSGGSVPILLVSGSLVEASFDSSLSSGDFGKPVFLSRTSGLLSVTPPAPPSCDLFRVGVLLSLSGSYGVFAFQPQFVARLP